MRQMGSRLIYWTSCNLQGCILNSRRVFRTQTEDGSLLRVSQEVPAAHMTASFRPSGSHAIRTVSRVALGASRGRPRAR